MLMSFIRGQTGLGELAAWLIAVVIAITVHEFAHAKSAELAGDSTPRRMGRVTLNPLAHYDPLGSTMFLLMGFGWAKPVPINPAQMRHPQRDTVLVSLWGPLSNLLMAAVLAVPVRLGVLGDYLLPVLIIIFANLLLAIFNLIPIGPLDGAHVLEGLLSPKGRQRLQDFYRRNQQWLLLAFLVVFLVPEIRRVVFGVILVPVQLLLGLLVGPIGGIFGA
jgi:Zn-dependent protease